MQSTNQTHHEKVELKMLGLLKDTGLPAPDVVEYGDTEVRFLWHDRKVCVVVDLDEDA